MTNRHVRPVQLGHGFRYIGEYLRAELEPNACRHRIRSRISQVAKIAVAEEMNDCALNISRSCGLVGKDKANG